MLVYHFYFKKYALYLMNYSSCNLHYKKQSLFEKSVMLTINQITQEYNISYQSPLA